VAGEGAAAVRDAWPRHVGLKVEPGRRAICGKGGVSIAGGAGGGLREHRRVSGPQRGGPGVREKQTLFYPREQRISDARPIPEPRWFRADRTFTLTASSRK